jgi:hypothetical protein
VLYLPPEASGFPLLHELVDETRRSLPALDGCSREDSAHSFMMAPGALHG